MREIGSEFWDVPVGTVPNGLFPESTQWFLSGRSALQAILHELKDCHSVAMPSWCCDSMVKPFVDAGFEVRFYPVFWQNGLRQEISTNCDVLFLMDYFGYTGPSPDLRGYHGVVIRDVTHSLFSVSYQDADYSFGSLRKWCGIWTGGFCWTQDGHQISTGESDDSGYTALRETAMTQKAAYIFGQRADKDYLKVFDAAEELLEHAGISPAAERDVQLARRLNAEEIKNRRRANANVLRRAFPDWLVFPTMQKSDCPMFVPVLVPDGSRDALRRHLIAQDIYCPVHWPVSAYHILDGTMTDIYQNELSLVCDQRYTEQDMTRMIETIRQFRKEA